MLAARAQFVDPAADASRLLCRLALIVLLILTPLAELQFRGALYVLLPVGAGILVVAGGIAGGPQNRKALVAALLSPIGLSALFLISWTGLSLVWTPFQAVAAARFGKALGTGFVVFLAIAFLPPKTKASNLYLVPLGVALTAVATAALVLFGPQAFSKGPDPDSTLAQRAIMAVCLLLWPALGALVLRERWTMAAALAVVATAAALAAFVPIALAAIAVGAIVYAAAMTQPIRTGKILAFAVAGMVLLTPVGAVLLRVVGSLAHLPREGSVMALAGAITAHGARLVTGHGFDFAAPAIALGVLPPSTPHSILFTLWYELGLLGALAFACLGAYVFLAAGRASPQSAPPLLAGIAAGLVIAVWGAETTQIWWITLAGLDAIALALIVKGHPRARRPHAPAGEKEATDDASPRPVPDDLDGHAVDM